MISSCETPDRICNLIRGFVGILRCENEWFCDRITKIHEVFQIKGKVTQIQSTDVNIR